ncbi:putative ABC-type RTX toxin transporter, ATPase and permease components [Bradyrhizobium oligotrophicum S58]|uniref:Putative ABC-type RTX toxin transporter, ATPase and permease components n=2 Tax=Bradyrhizobium oligotrophicum TaxID=44255 RepID=M4ZAI3_9BRAD|nr:putative ABC-type RTX toxin transporter, ATPase and permease components [Bradyrhizobium oligotrophicum S58]
MQARMARLAKWIFEESLNIRPTRFELEEAPPVMSPVSPAAPAPDPLSDSLLYLAAHHGRALSRSALLSGLPLETGVLSIGLYERAAQRAGLEAQLVERPLSEIPALVLPCVLMFHDGTTRILLTIDEAAGRVTIVDPSHREAPAIERVEMVAAQYVGFAYLVRPAAIADPRVMAASELPKTHWFWSVVSRFGANYGHVAIAAFIVNILALAAPLFTMSVYDRVIPNGAIPSLVALGVGLALAIGFDFLLKVVRSRIIDMTGKKIDVVLAANIFEHVMALKMDKRPPSVGILANQMRDFDSVREFFTSGTVVSATDMLFAVVFIIVLFIIAGPIAWIPLLMLPVMIGVGLFIQRPLDRAMRRMQAQSAARHGILVESLNGMETVRAVAGESRVQTVWERSVAAQARSSEDVQFWASMAMTAASVASQLCSLLLVTVGVFLILDGKLSVGALVAANMLSGRVLGPIAGIAGLMTRFTQTTSALRSIDRLMSMDRERPPEKIYVAREINQGRIQFKNVSFSYPGSQTKALDNVSFDIKPGEKIGIIGRVGSGKTTVGRLATAFYPPTEGSILIDGIDIQQYDPADLRAGIGFVLQDTDLFYGKLRDNITLGRPAATDEEVLEAARLAGVETFIAGHPQGYEMMIAEGGRSLSGGQKQAIGLARVLIRKPRVLFLDEPTAHFDVRSEGEFLERLKVLAKGDKTGEMSIIVSTHRPSLLSLVDRILVFDAGKIVADGPTAQILTMLRPQQPAAAPAASHAVKPVQGTR